MCDIYTDYCRGCGTPIEMHLGDFETNPWEISVFCEKCITTPYWFGQALPHCIWKCEGEGPTGKIAVVAITKHAWENRAHNYPNSDKLIMVDETKEA